MNKKNFVSKCILILGIATFLLGCIHNAVTLHLHDTIYPLVSDGNSSVLETYRALIYCFVAVGITLNFTGLLSVYCSFHLKNQEKWAWLIALAIGIFQFVLGLGAIYAMPEHPPAFIFAFLGLFEVLPLLLFKNQIFSSNI